MKTIGVVAVDKKCFRSFLTEIGVHRFEEIRKFSFIGRIDDIMGREFIAVIRAYPYSQDWKFKQDELFEHAKGRIR